MGAVGILYRWLEYANRTKATAHYRAFWIALDHLENILPRTAGELKEAREFIERECKESGKREIVLSALENAIKEVLP